jgi:hypothetical protein
MKLKVNRFLLACLIITSSVLNSCGAKQDQELIVQSLPRSDELIIYIQYNSENDRNELWAINPNKLTPIFITDELVNRRWSPSNKLWLLTGNQSIYLANDDGSEIRNIYTYGDEYEGVDPFWLTEDIILFNAYEDSIFLPPDVYSLSIRSGKITRLFPEIDNFIQSTFPSKQKWLLASYPSGSLDMVDKDGKSENFFDDFSIVADPHVPYPKIQLVNRLDKYLVQAKRNGDTSYKLWLLSELGTHQMLFDPEDEGIDQFAVSPNEEYVALTYNTVELPGVYVYVISLDNLQLLYKWMYPYKLGTGYFIWSPDSKSIVLHYSESDAGSSTTVNSGIQIMDITTGETKIILKEDVELILDWHFIGQK